MNLETKLVLIEHFTNWLREKLIDNMCENKSEKFEDILYQYFDENDFQYEDEHETYETMRDKSPEVEHLLKKLLKIDDGLDDIVTVEFWSGNKKVAPRKDILAWLWDCVINTEGAEHDENFDAYCKVQGGAKKIKF